MPGGRPTKYKKEFCDSRMPDHGSVVIYALCNKEGLPFYVGKSANFRKRLQAYKALNAHGNMALKQCLSKWALDPKWAILEENPKDVTAVEYDWINCIPNLCNIMLEPFYANSPKPWVVSGSKCPTAQVRQHVKRNVKGNVDWIKDHANSLSNDDRLKLECRVAKSFLHTDIGKSLQKWLDGAVSKGILVRREKEYACP